MTPEERERMFALCNEIATEKDAQRFHKLLRELNDLLERKDRRLERPDSPSPQKQEP